MLKAILGSVLGGLAAGVVALVAWAPARTAAPWPTASAQPVGMVDTFGSRAATAEPALVECEAHQRAELRRVVMNGREVAQVACVTPVPPYAQSVSAEATAGPHRSSISEGGSDIVVAPSPAAPTVATRPAVVRERVVTPEPARRASNRSWAKSALMIGGVGGLVDGKKGALIGAAIGGGSAAIYEAAKRR